MKLLENSLEAPVMCHVAKDGSHLFTLVADAATLLKSAQEFMPVASGPGRPQVYELWQIALLIFIAILHRRKSKSAQCRFLAEHAALLKGLGPHIRLERLPSRASYMRRYHDAYRLYEKVLELGGRRALRDHVADAEVVAVDKSMIAAQGQVPPVAGSSQTPRGVDREAGWGRSAHDGWVWGYSYELVVSAGKHGLILPLLASADQASKSEHRSFGSKIPRLPASTRRVLGDGGTTTTATRTPSNTTDAAAAIHDASWRRCSHAAASRRWARNAAKANANVCVSCASDVNARSAAAAARRCCGDAAKPSSRTTSGSNSASNWKSGSGIALWTTTARCCWPRSLSTSACCVTPSPWAAATVPCSGSLTRCEL